MPKLSSNFKVGAATKESIELSLKLREKLKTIRKSMYSDNYDISMSLFEAKEKGYFVDWGYTNIYDYGLKELELEDSKMRLYLDMGKFLNLVSYSLQDMLALSWSKCLILVSIFRKLGFAPKTIKMWVEKAKQLSALELKTYTKGVIEKDTVKCIEEVKSYFKLPLTDSTAIVVSSAIEEAKDQITKESGKEATVSDSVQLIVQEWISQKELSPRRITLMDHIKYLEKVYGVKLMVVSESDSCQDFNNVPPLQKTTKSSMYSEDTEVTEESNTSLEQKPNLPDEQEEGVFEIPDQPEKAPSKDNVVEDIPNPTLKKRKRRTRKEIREAKMKEEESKTMPILPKDTKPNTESMGVTYTGDKELDELLGMA